MLPNGEQRPLQEAARRFARERLLPGYMQREKDGVVDRKLLREMGALGLLGVDVAPEHGGLGVDSVTTGLIVEELAYGDFNISAIVLVMSLCGAIISQVMAGSDYSRALIALQCLGAAQASLDEAWAYTQERVAFGGLIARFQGVSFPLVEGETQIAAARQLSYHALALRDAGLAHTVEAAMVKWLAPRTAFDVIHQCLLTFGHYGWTLDLPHQQRMRDVMGLEIGDGTAGIMKMIVARARAGRAATEQRGTAG